VLALSHELSDVLRADPDVGVDVLQLVNRELQVAALDGPVRLGLAQADLAVRAARVLVEAGLVVALGGLDVRGHIVLRSILLEG
jgi:hypothetical protein